MSPPPTATPPTATIVNDTLAALPTPLGVLALEYHAWPLVRPPRADSLTVGTRTDLHLILDHHGGSLITTELPPAQQQRYAPVTSAVPAGGHHWRLLGDLHPTPNGWQFTNQPPLCLERGDHAGRTLTADPDLIASVAALLQPVVDAWMATGQARRLQAAARRHWLQVAIGQTQVAVTRHTSDLHAARRQLADLHARLRALPETTEPAEVPS